MNKSMIDQELKNKLIEAIQMEKENRKTMQVQFEDLLTNSEERQSVLENLLEKIEAEENEKVA